MRTKASEHRRDSAALGGSLRAAEATLWVWVWTAGLETAVRQPDCLILTIRWEKQLYLHKLEIRSSHSPSLQAMSKHEGRILLLLTF